MIHLFLKPTLVDVGKLISFGTEKWCALCLQLSPRIWICPAQNKSCELEPVTWHGYLYVPYTFDCLLSHSSFSQLATHSSRHWHGCLYSLRLFFFYPSAFRPDAFQSHTRARPQTFRHIPTNDQRGGKHNFKNTLPFSCISVLRVEYHVNPHSRTGYLKKIFKFLVYTNIITHKCK